MSFLKIPDLRANILSGLTVSLALVPEAIAFALVAHVSPLTGLYAAFIVCFITAVFGGRPGMISGATGALAVVMVSLVVRHGVEYLFATVVLMGLLQILFAACRLGKLIRMVPHSVMVGFVNGLAIVIFKAQFGHFKTVNASGEAVWMSRNDLITMFALIAVTMAIIYLLPKFTRAVPSSLAAILTVSGLVALLGIKTKTVGEMGSIAGGLPKFHIPQVPLNVETFYIIFPYAVILAAIGLLETLLTLNLVDSITDTKGRPNKESMAQGVANVVSGFFASMGGCAMIGQSMINIDSGARHRISGIVAATSLLGFILFISPWIEMIPLAALIGLMFVVSQKTFDWSSIANIKKIPKHDAIIVVGVMTITVVTDLAIAVLSGVVFAALHFAWEHAKHIEAVVEQDEFGWKVYGIKGSLYFASTAEFQRLFSPAEDPEYVAVEFAQAKLMDHSAIEAVDVLVARYKAVGKTLHLRHLSPACFEMLDRAKAVEELDGYEHPHYHMKESKRSGH